MSSFHQRVIGAVSLNAATFEEVEHDAGATVQAGIIVAVASLTTSVGWYFGIGSAEWILRGALHAQAAWVVGALAVC